MMVEVDTAKTESETTGGKPEAVGIFGLDVVW